MSYSDDPTQGGGVGSAPGEDPTGTGRDDPTADATQGREVGEQSYEDPTQGGEVGEQPDEDATQGDEIGSPPGEDPTGTS
jgi:hypothetical protein